MQDLKDVLAILMIAVIVAIVVALSFMFAVVMIPMAIMGVIYCYVKDERLENVKNEKLH